MSFHSVILQRRWLPKQRTVWYFWVWHTQGHTSLQDIKMISSWLVNLHSRKEPGNFTLASPFPSHKTSSPANIWKVNTWSGWNPQESLHSSVPVCSSWSVPPPCQWSLNNANTIPGYFHSNLGRRGLGLLRIWKRRTEYRDTEATEPVQLHVRFLMCCPFQLWATCHSWDPSFPSFGVPRPRPFSFHYPVAPVLTLSLIIARGWRELDSPCRHRHQYNFFPWAGARFRDRHYTLQQVFYKLCVIIIRRNL